MINRIVTSTNFDPKYLDFWKIQLLAHLTFIEPLGINLSIAFVQGGPFNADIRPIVKKLNYYGVEVVHFNGKMDGYDSFPIANASKVARWLTAGLHGDEVCCVTDVDTIPLTGWYVKHLSDSHENGKLLAVGAEVLAGGPDDGKFPAHHTTASGRIFYKTFNMVGEYYPNFLNLVGFGGKADITGHPSYFSDESLIRDLIAKNNIPVKHITRDINIKTQWIDRSWWGMDRDRLYRGEYIEANLLRPINGHFSQIEPIIRYIESKGNLKYDDI